MAAPEELAAQLDAIIGASMRDRVYDYAEGFAYVYQAEAPRDTGELAGALRSNVAPEGDGRVVLHLEVDDEAAPHGKWIDQPVDLIVPVRAKALHWFSKSGEEVFARQVHPSRVHEGWWRQFVDQGIEQVVR